MKKDKHTSDDELTKFIEADSEEQEPDEIKPIYHHKKITQTPARAAAQKKAIQAAQIANLKRGAETRKYREMEMNFLEKAKKKMMQDLNRKLIIEYDEQLRREEAKKAVVESDSDAPIYIKPKRKTKKIVVQSESETTDNEIVYVKKKKEKPIAVKKKPEPIQEEYINPYKVDSRRYFN